MRKPGWVRQLAVMLIGASLTFSGLAVERFESASLTAAQEVQTGEPAAVNVDSLVVRSGPSLDSTVNLSLPFGTGIVVIDGPVAADGYDWFQLEQDGVTIGWAVQGFSQTGAVEGAVTSVTSGALGSGLDIQIGGRVAVNVDSLVVRSQPGLSGTVNRSLALGAEAVVIDGPVAADGYDWYQLQQDENTIGWSVQGFLQIAPPAAITVPPAQTIWTVTAGFLEIRSDPDDEAGIARIVTVGTRLTQTGENVELDGVLWFPVDDLGWIGGLSDDLALEQYPLYVQTEVLNVRSAPDLSGTIVQTLNYGDTVNAFDTLRDADGIAWSAVNEEGTLWVAADYLAIQPLSARIGPSLTIGAPLTLPPAIS